MRRVVITGLGMVSPLACGVEETWSRLIAGESGAGRITRFDASSLATHDRLRGAAAATGRRHLQPRRLDVDEGAAQGRHLHPLRAWRRPQQAVEDSGWMPEDEADRERTGVIDRLRDRRAAVDRGDDADPEGEGAAARLAVLHPGRADQPLLRAGVDPLRLQGAEPCGRDRLLHRRARHRRRGAADPVRRRRRDDRRRRRGGDLRDRHRRLQRLQGAVDELQRRAGAGRAGPTTATATAS